MKIPDIREIEAPSDVRYSAMLELQKELNKYLQELFESSKAKGREYLATIVIEKVEATVDELNKAGYELGRSDYGGDVNYENSEQWYSNGAEMGTGLIIHFLGFSAQVSWESA